MTQPKRSRALESSQSPLFKMWWDSTHLMQFSLGIWRISTSGLDLKKKKKSKDMPGKCILCWAALATGRTRLAWENKRPQEDKMETQRVTSLTRRSRTVWPFGYLKLDQKTKWCVFQGRKASLFQTSESYACAAELTRCSQNWTFFLSWVKTMSILFI